MARFSRKMISNRSRCRRRGECSMSGSGNKVVLQFGGNSNSTLVAKLYIAARRGRAAACITGYSETLSCSARCNATACGTRGVGAPDSDPRSAEREGARADDSTGLRSRDDVGGGCTGSVMCEKSHACLPGGVEMSIPDCLHGRQSSIVRHPSWPNRGPDAS